MILTFGSKRLEFTGNRNNHSSGNKIAQRTVEQHTYITSGELIQDSFRDIKRPLVARGATKH